MNVFTASPALADHIRTLMRAEPYGKQLRFTVDEQFIVAGKLFQDAALRSLATSAVRGEMSVDFVSLDETDVAVVQIVGGATGVDLVLEREPRLITDGYGCLPERTVVQRSVVAAVSAQIAALDRLRQPIPVHGMLIPAELEEHRQRLASELPPDTNESYEDFRLRMAGKPVQDVELPAPTLTDILEGRLPGDDPLFPPEAVQADELELMGASNHLIVAAEGI